MLKLNEQNCLSNTIVSLSIPSTALPADWVNVKAFQNGVELGVLVPTGERTNGYVQCDTSVQSGTTADVVWFFQLDDDSEVSIEITGSDTITVPLTEE